MSRIASKAANVVPGITDTNNADDVFLRDLQNNATAILSVDSAGNALGNSGNAILRHLTFSPDSHYLAFQTQASNMVAGISDTNNAPDLFVRDLTTGVTSVVTVNAAGTATGNSTSSTSTASSI